MVENRYWICTGLPTYHYPYLFYISLLFSFKFAIVITINAKDTPEK